MLLYILANLLLLVLWLGIINLLDSKNSLTLLEKYVVGFLTGIALNSFFLFIFAWSGVSIAFVKYLDVALFAIIFFWNYKKDILRRLYHSQFSFPKFTKRDFFIIPIVILILFKAFFSLFQSVNVPSYFDDEKGNWNIKSKVIYEEKTINTQSGSESYVGWGGHREYPLQFILYKSYVADFMGEWNDSYINIITWIVFNLTILLVVFSFSDRVFASIIAYLMYSLPLVVWHSWVAYYDLIYACFYLLSLFFFVRYTKTSDRVYLYIIGILLYSVIFTKNEGMMLVAPSLLAGIGFYMYQQKKMKELFYIGIPVLFIIPHMIFRAVHHLSFNPHSGDASYEFHSDSLGLYFTYFTQWGSYNIFWYILPLVLLFCGRNLFEKKYLPLTISLSVLALIIFLVFSFTNNYQFLLSQTTINRTLLCFMIPAIYLCGMIIQEKLSLKKV